MADIKLSLSIYMQGIKHRVHWTLVKSHIDDGKSGLTTQKRKDFLNLLVDAYDRVRKSIFGGIAVCARCGWF